MNFGFDFDTDYDQLTSKNIFANKTLEFNESADGDDFTKDELKRLLICLDNDLKQKEDEVKLLTTEKNALQFYDIKYGKINEPFFALRRDAAVAHEKLDERQLANLQESQLIQLEILIGTQRRALNKAKHLLHSAEKRHAKSLQDLELEKERKRRYAEQGDDVLALLEKERNKLLQQLDSQNTFLSNSQEERAKLEKRLQAEKEKHKMMVLFLITERKQLLVKVHELRMKLESQQKAPPVSTDSAQLLLLEELKKEVAFLRQERDVLSNANKSMKVENLSLKEVVAEQEADLALLRRKSGSSMKLPEKSGHMVQSSGDDRAFVVANKMAAGASSGSVPRIRLANSSSFPTERSRLPRAPSSPARNATISRLPSSPTKKIPAMGISTVRIRTPPAVEPELQQLDDVIKSMGDGPNVAPSSPSKRSSSLPRSVNKVENTAPPKAESRPIPQMGSRIAPRTDSSIRKTSSSTVKRNGLSTFAKTFGK